MADQLLTGTTLVENTSRSQGDVPVGGVIPWLKSLTGVYSYGEGWVECNGQTLVDPLSSLNGQTIPDLNGFTGNQRFLRGGGNADGTTATASGATGGSDTVILGTGQLPDHNHTFGIADDSLGGGTIAYGGGFSQDEILVTGGINGAKGDAHENKPSYYSVVWIMRIR